MLLDKARQALLNLLNCVHFDEWFGLEVGFV